MTVPLYVLHEIILLMGMVALALGSLAGFFIWRPDEKVICQHGQVGFMHWLGFRSSPVTCRADCERVQLMPDDTQELPPTVTDAQYRQALLGLMITPEDKGSLDPAFEYTIQELEECIIRMGMQLPLVRRLNAQ